MTYLRPLTFHYTEIRSGKKYNSTSMIKLNTNRILIPVDFSATSTKAIVYAATIAKLNKGELFLLYVRAKKSTANIKNSIADLRELTGESENYKKLLEKTANEIREKYSIPVKVIIGVGNRISEIINVAEKKRVGLIVMGTRGSESASNLFSGSNSHKVVSRSQIPVMTVRNENRKAKFSNILLPIDLSEHTRQKVNVAIQVAKMHAAKIHLLGMLGSGDASDFGKLSSIMYQVKKRIEQDDIEVSSELIKFVGNFAARTLSNVRRSKADVIITMTDQKNGKGFLARKFDRELVDESAIPVLSIPPEIHEENIAPSSIGGLW